MRILARSLSTATILITLSSLPASAAAVARAGAPAPAPETSVAPELAPQIRLVRLATTPGKDGRQTVRFGVFQRVAPLLAVAGGDEVPEVVVRAADVVEASYSVDMAGWQTLGSLTVEHLDGAAPAAALGPSDADAAAQAGERLELTLAPVRPNPAHGEALAADVVLPTAAAARLELVDVQGRRVITRDLGSLGVGRHTVDLAQGRRLAPGVYLLRLSQGGSVRVTRVAVIE